MIFSDVADGICKKLIIRHPHVFGNITADTPEEVLKNWDDIKMKTKSQTKASEAMDSVAKSLPALMRADKIRSKAKKQVMHQKAMKLHMRIQKKS